MPLSKRNSVDKAKLLKISLKAKIMGILAMITL